MIDHHPTPRLRPVIRVFVSSTFSDMRHERNALQEHVYPKLEQHCQKQGFQFQAIDLRWGVSSEAGLDHRTMRICFDELRRAQEISPRPNFLILLGNRYGWRPLPEEISAAEFQALEGAAITIGESALAVLHVWYRKDEDAVPPVYLLQSRLPHVPDWNGCTETSAWNETQAVLWEIINRTMPPERLPGRFDEATLPAAPLPPIVRFQTSATEQEIWQGALRVPDAKEHVVAFFREIEDVGEFSKPKQLEKIKDFIDVQPTGGIDRGLHAEQERLKRHLRDRLGAANVFEARSVKLTTDITTDHLEKLCADVETRLTQIIQSQIDEYWQQTKPGSAERATRELAIEQQEHARTSQERGGTKAFVGREVELTTIHNYLLNDSAWPLVVCGASGCGKTSLMGCAARESEELKPLVRLIGIHPRCSDLRGLLTSLCQELRLQHPCEGELPMDIKLLEVELHEQFKKASADQPLILFLDALDQLADTDGGRLLRWLPVGALPTHVKLVVSCLSDRAEGEPAGQPYVELLRRQLPTTQFINLDALSEGEARKLLFERWLPQTGRTVSRDQRACIEQRLASAVCRQPIYLKLLFEEIRLWRSYDATPEIGEDVRALLDQFFGRLCQKTNHGPLLVARVLGYLAASREGLAESEILEILFRDPEYKKALDDATKDTRHEMPPNAKRIPIAIWSRLRFDLDSYLTERAAVGANVLTFYHRQVAEWVNDHSAKSSDQRCRCHSMLADYFRVLADPEMNQRWKCDNPRPFSELAFQLFTSGNRTALASILANVTFVAAKAGTGAILDLLHDYDVLLDNNEANISRESLLQLVAILHHNTHGLWRYPSCSLQQILLGIAALERPDPQLSTQAAQLMQFHGEDRSISFTSLLPEHRVRGVLQIPSDQDEIVETCGGVEGRILIRYRGGRWVELSRDMGRIAQGSTPSAYSSTMSCGNGMLVLCSANIAQIWDVWPEHGPIVHACSARISSAACAQERQCVVLGCDEGSYEVLLIKQGEVSVCVSGHLQSTIVSTWFVDRNSVALVTADGGLHHVGLDGDYVTRPIQSTVECQRACMAGASLACLQSTGNRLCAYNLNGESMWNAVLPETPCSLAFGVNHSSQSNLIVVGLRDGSLQLVDASRGVLHECIRVSQTALMHVEPVVDGRFFICKDASHLVFMVDSPSYSQRVSFRSWPFNSPVLSAWWDKKLWQLRVVTQDGDCIAIKEEVGKVSTEWSIAELRKNDAPFDNACFMPDGSIIALHRESDESQIWRHMLEPSHEGKSRRLWHGRSVLFPGPCYVHAFGLSRCGKAYALASDGAGEGHGYISQGRIGMLGMVPRWRSWDRSIDDLVLSSKGIAVVITQTRVSGGSCNTLAPARLLLCRGFTHTLMESGWGGGARGRERGITRGLFGTAISDDARVIAAVDYDHNLWLFDYDPDIPNKPPRGKIVLADVISCELSGSGHMLVALQMDMAIRLLSTQRLAMDDSPAILPVPGQVHYMKVFEEHQCLVVSGQNFIQVVSFRRSALK